jgi:hypothetical protein
LRINFNIIFIYFIGLFVFYLQSPAQIIYTCKNRPVAPALKDLPLVDSLSQYGITWKFGQKVHIGKFITGDYYVVGPVTVLTIVPVPENGRNGSMLNGSTSYESGYDNRTIRYSEKLFVKPPVNLKPGYSLISSISLSEDELDRPPVMPRGGVPQTYLKSAAVLTCVRFPLNVDAFRPSYSDTSSKIYRASDLHRELLPKLERVDRTPDLATWERIFDRPWIDHTQGWGNRQTHPTDNMPEYSRELSRAVSIVSLMLMLDFTAQEKENLLLSMVQYGIDLWGAALNGGGWEAAGGYGNGRKWPIIFAGILLQDEKMQRPNTIVPNIRFGEDEQTVYGKAWTGAKVMFAGHSGIHGSGDRGAYEHLPPSEWPGPIKAQSEAYRRVSTSISWVGQFLSARSMHAEKLWDHDAYFDYVDRWMTEDDTRFIDEIVKQLGDNYMHIDAICNYPQRKTVDIFVDNMWAKYRNNIPEKK